jgi:hypothetical protein
MIKSLAILNTEKKIREGSNIKRGSRGSDKENSLVIIKTNNN